MTARATAPILLVIDDEESICLGFRRFFQRRGWQVDAAPSASAGREAFCRRRPDVVFLDVRLGDADGLSLLGEFKAIDPDVPVIVITAYGGLETVVGSMEADAFDYLPKPIDLDLAHRRALRATSGESSGDPTGRPACVEAAPATGLVGSCPAMQEVYKRIAVLARSDCTVLIGGPTGTGKELVARAIHRHSPRRDGPFVAVNCGALPDGLVASELFGHVRGAFTGADEDRAGKLEVANGGTLLLDEVGDLPPAAQVKLLRAVDQRTIERVGSTRPVALDVRLIAATHRDLPGDVEDGRFRRDLYYRLAVAEVTLPPLRRRGRDVLALAAHFLADRPGPRLAMSDEAREALLAHDWPGNVRELRNAVDHAAALARGGTIHLEDLPRAVRGTRTQAPAGDAVRAAAANLVRALLPGDRAAHDPAEPGAGLHARAVGALEAELIEWAMDRCAGNQSEAAALLGLHRNTLRRKLANLDQDDT